MSITAPAATRRDPATGAGPVLAYLALCFIWGSTYLGIRMAVETMPPPIMVGVRSVLAGLVMAGFALARGARMPAAPRLASIAAAGLLLFAGGQVGLGFAELRLPSGQAAVLNATQALVMPLAAWAIGAGRAPAAGSWAGLLLGFAGVAILLRPGAGAVDPLGLVVLLGSVLAWSLGGAVAQRWRGGPVALVAGLQMVSGGIAALCLGAALGSFHGFSWAQVSARSWIGFAYLVTVGSFAGFGAFAWLVQIWPMERLATYTYVNPVVALMLGLALNGERVTLREIGATVLILAAVGVVMWSAQRRTARH